MTSYDLEALKAYVTAQDGKEYSGLSDSTVVLSVSHSNLKQRWPEIRFDLSTRIGELKEKLYRHGGTSPAFQRLELGEDRVVLKDDSKPLGFYGPQSGMELRIVDLDPNSLAKSGWLEDTSKVEKFKMSEEEYAKRENTVRRYKELERAKQLSMGSPGGAVRNTSLLTLEEAKTVYALGGRCEVGPGGRRGTVAYVGNADGVLGTVDDVWIGVILDEPLGKNNGEVRGKRFFTCGTNLGVFANPEKVEMGAFPVRGLDDDDEM